MSDTNLLLRKVLLELYSKCKDSIMCMNGHIEDINGIFNKSITDLEVGDGVDNFVGGIMKCGLTSKEKDTLTRLLT